MELIRVCEFCKKELTDSKSKRFCSRGCSNRFRTGIIYETKYNPDAIRIIYKCLNCDSKINHNRNEKRKFCSKSCFGSYSQKQTLNKIRNGTFKLNGVGNAKNRYYKLFLVTEYGHKCMVCNTSEWMGQPIPLQVDHLDGNSDNDELSNIRIICPNCHAQTSNYCGKNKGNGKRKHRLEDYHNGKDKW